MIAIDRGEANFAVAVAVSKHNVKKPLKGKFWRGSETKRVRGLYNHIRRRLGEKKLLKKIKGLGRKEKRKVNQQLSSTFLPKGGNQAPSYSRIRRAHGEDRGLLHEVY